MSEQNESKKVKCDRCRYLDVEGDFFTETYFKCEKGVHDLKPIEEIEDHEVVCDQYKSKYIEYPLTITAIHTPKERAVVDGFRPTGSLVKIRPCGGEYENQTFLGILLGDVDIHVSVSHSEETGELNIRRSYNPGIFVPALKKVVYGCESWWGIIKSEEELQSISDKDIQDTWYVKLWKDMNSAGAEEDDSSEQLALDLDGSDS